jgi:hypothetical protein
MDDACFDEALQARHAHEGGTESTFDEYPVSDWDPLKLLRNRLIIGSCGFTGNN